MDTTLPQLFSEAAGRFPARPAIVHDAGTISYAELAAAVDALASRLQEVGLGGRRVGILLPNLPVFPLVFHAVLRAGCPALLLNPLNSRREVEEYLRDAEVRDVFVTRALAALLPTGTGALLVDGLPDEIALVDGGDARTLPLAGAPPSAAAVVDPGAEAAILYTAASRGWARGAVLSHRNLVANLRSTIEAMRLTPADVVLAALPMIHAFGLTVGLNASLGAGAAIVPVERFNPTRVLELIEQRGVTIFAGVPAMFIALIAAVERREMPAHSLRVALCGGAPLDAEVARRWEESFGMPLRQGYGLTEAAPVCLFNRLDLPNRPGSLGHPFPGVEVSVRDPAGEELAVDEVGELCVRGANVFSGYLDDAGRTPREFFGDWLRTGDLASASPDGSVRFRGVSKPMFTRNGFNVYPAELERVLESHPGVAAATVCALPHPVRENDIVVFLRSAPGATLAEEEVRDFCRTHLAAYKQPTRIEIEA